MCAIKWKKIFHGFIGAATGGGSVFLYLLVRDYFGLNLPSWPLSIFSLIIALFVSVFVHELGHLIGGLTQKFQFYKFTVGPFKVEKINNGLQAGLNLNLNVAGGLTVMLPSSKNLDKKKLAMFIAGGPIASLLLFIILASSAITLHTIYGSNGIVNNVIYFSWMTAVITLVLGILSLIPEEETGLESDGLQLKDLLLGGERALIKQYVMQLSVTLWSGTRPRDLDKTLLTDLNKMTEGQIGSHSIFTKLLLYVHYMDNDEKEYAETVLNNGIKIAEAQNNDLLNGTIFLEKSFFEAYCNENFEKADYYYKKGKEGYSEKSTLKRAETALNILKKDIESAKIAAEDAFKLLHNSHDKGGAIWEKEILSQLLEMHKISVSQY